MMMRSGWFGESYRHYLAAKYGGAPHQYMMAGARLRLPQYQLAEIARVRGASVAKEARDVALEEQLTAKQLADRYGVAYVRGKGLAGQQIVERLREEHVVTPSTPDAWAEEYARRAKLETLGRPVYEEEHERALQGVREAKQQLLDEEHELATFKGLKDQFQVDQKMRDVRALKTIVALREGELSRMEQQAEKDGYRSFLPADVVQTSVVPDVLPRRLKPGQARLGEFDIEVVKPVKGQLALRDFMKRKDAKEKYREEHPDLVKRFAGENPRITENYARFRQRSPDDFVPGTLRTKHEKHGAVIVGKDKRTGKYVVQSVLIARKRYQKLKRDEERAAQERYEEYMETLPAERRAEIEAKIALMDPKVRRARHQGKGYMSARVVTKKGKTHVTRSGEEVKEHARETVEAVRPLARHAVVAGSIRRRVADPVDVDVVVVPKREQDIGRIKDIVKRGATKIYQDGNYKLAVRKHGIKTEVVFAKPSEFGATLMYATGPSGANIYHRRQAKERGWKLNQNGLYDRRGKLLASSEKGIYHKLGLSYRRPEERGLPR